MKLSQFQFNLPAEKIATEPPRWRDECKLMVLDRKTGEIEHKLFKNIIDYFGKGDTFVLNDTKVFPARLYGNKEKTGADIEVFLLRELNREQRLWDVIVDPARKIVSAISYTSARTRALLLRLLTTQLQEDAPSVSSMTEATKSSRLLFSDLDRLLSQTG